MDSNLGTSPTSVLRLLLAAVSRVERCVERSVCHPLLLVLSRGRKGHATEDCNVPFARRMCGDGGTDTDPQLLRPGRRQLATSPAVCCGARRKTERGDDWATDKLGGSMLHPFVVDIHVCGTTACVASGGGGGWFRGSVGMDVGPRRGSNRKRNLAIIDDEKTKDEDEQA